jgi:hypothetical protein
MTDVTHAYLIVKPCGCVVELCVDSPDQAHAIGGMSRYAVRRGYSLQRVTLEEARAAASRLTGAKARCEHDEALS